MTPESLKKAQKLTSTIGYLDEQIESIKRSQKVEGMGFNYASFELTDTMSNRVPYRDGEFDSHYETVDLGQLPLKAQNEIFQVFAKTARSKLEYRRKVAKKELAAL